MPSLGSDMEAGTLIEWLVKPGDTVARGDIVAVVETQKGAIEIETFETGTVRELIADIGQVLPVGEPLAIIGETDDSLPAASQQAPSVAPPVAPSVVPSVAPPVAPSEPLKPAPAVAATAPQAPPQPQLSPSRASPAARQAAQAAGLDLATLQGTGLGGAIVLVDVETAVHKGDVPPPRERGGLSEMRKAVAAAMTRSKREIPHFYVLHTIETQSVSEWLASHNADRPPSERILLGAAFIKAAALAARSVGALNGHFADNRFAASETIHIGVAIALRGGGLVAPSLENTDLMPLQDVMSGMRDLVTRARSGRLRSTEIASATLTVSSLGEGGAEAMAGVIFPPQVALLTVGSPQVRPWVVGKKVQPREVTTFGLSADHRVCDGRQASKFLTELADKLAKPELL